MTYLRVAYSAVMRHRIEKPIRTQFLTIFPNAKQRVPFQVMLHRLTKRKLITKTHAKKMQNSYKQLSKMMHA